MWVLKGADCSRDLYKHTDQISDITFTVLRFPPFHTYFTLYKIRA